MAASAGSKTKLGQQRLNTSTSNTSSNRNTDPLTKVKILAMDVLGSVKWFNVKNRYGFITWNVNKEDVFVHKTAIKKNNLRKYPHSLGDEKLWHLI